MTTIQATVNPRLLNKANRLFTGTLRGRITEILQNARRAGATEVVISNNEGLITVHDNGCGVADFARLLDLGGSGWDASLEESEDPAGVGLFCLAPREVTIRSMGKTATIADDGWTGEPVPVKAIPVSQPGTTLEFHDDAWTKAEVEPLAVFSGMLVTVDGEACAMHDFVSPEATHHPDLGCRIEVRETKALHTWHMSSVRSRYYSENCLVNFHGQVLALDCHPISEHGLHYLVDMTGEPTGIRLMLPARTRLVENEAFEALQKALELEAYRYLQRRGQHQLPYKEYRRAHELRVELPEATPTFSVGLLTGGDAPQPIEVAKPEDFPLARCYRFDPNYADGTESDETSVHLLAALGEFDQPFVPVQIHDRYDGYSWAKLPTIGKVELKVGKTLHSSWLWSCTLDCVESIQVSAQASDGRVFSSAVCMAMISDVPEKGSGLSEDHLLVTPEAQHRLMASEIWHHFGGWSDEGDTYDTQLWDFERQLEQFWMKLIGPDEQLRRKLVEALRDVYPDWSFAKVFANGEVRIRFADGSVKTMRPAESR